MTSTNLSASEFFVLNLRISLTLASSAEEEDLSWQVQFGNCILICICFNFSKLSTLKAAKAAALVSSFFETVLQFIGSSNLIFLWPFWPSAFCFGLDRARPYHCRRRRPVRPVSRPKLPVLSPCFETLKSCHWSLCSTIKQQFDESCHCWVTDVSLGGLFRPFYHNPFPVEWPDQEASADAHFISQCLPKRFRSLQILFRS